MNVFLTITIGLLLRSSPASAPSDVPAGHWSGKAPGEVVSRGIMSAPNGKFNGDRAVTRRELTITLAQFAKSLIAHKWNAADAAAAPHESKSPGKIVTRYQLAATLTKLGPHVAAGLPAATGKPVYGSVVFPRHATVKAKPAEPGYAAAQYLAKEHMAFGDAVTLAPGPSSVTPAEVTKAISQVIIGVVDRLTDEPQNREEIAPPTRHR